MSLEAFRKRARALDREDPLKGFRSKFVVAKEPIYLDGNSLGRLPKETRTRMADLIGRQWGERLIQGWVDDWIELPRRLGQKVAQIVGAQDDEVIFCDSTSVNFYKIAHAVLSTQIGRNRIVTDEANFPSDLYLLQGLQRALPDIKITRLPSSDQLEPAALEAELGPDVCLLTLSHAAYRSGQLHDLDRLTRAAHRHGIPVLWDLSHSAGAVPIHLGRSRVDFAVGCGYKYLNGGPGAPAFVYVRRDLQSRMVSPIWGWFGQKDAFRFDPDYEPASGMGRFLAGTPPVLSMAALEPGLDLVIEAGIDALREKSLKQTDMLIELWDWLLKPMGVEMQTPQDHAGRGSHVSYGHPDAWRINRALIEEMGVIPDFRTPDTIRFGVAPLYTTYSELVEATERFRMVLEAELFRKFSEERSAVT